MLEGDALRALLILHKDVVDRDVIGSLIDQGLQLQVVEAFLLLRRPIGVVDDQPEVTVHLIADDCDLKLH